MKKYKKARIANDPNSFGEVTLTRKGGSIVKLETTLVPYPGFHVDNRYMDESLARLSPLAFDYVPVSNII